MVAGVQSKNDLKFDILAIVMIAIVVISIFVKYGFNVNGTMEEYTLLYLEAFNFSPDIHSTLRPFLGEAYMAGVYLTPKSFLGLNLLNIFFIWARATLFYVILRKLSFPYLVALMAGILIVVSPMSSNLLRLVAIQWVIVTYLLAFYAALFLQHKWNPIALIVMWIAAAISTLTYEAIYGMMMITPLVFFWRDGKFNRRTVLLTIAWYLAPLITGLRFLYYFINSDNAYQQGLIAVDSSLPTLMNYVLNTYVLSFFGQWFNSLRNMYNSSVLNIGISLCIALGLLLGMVILQRIHASANTKLSTNRWLAFIVISLLFIFFGISVYLPTGARVYFERVYVLSAIGAVIFLSLGIYLLLKAILPEGLYERIFLLLMTGFLFLSINTSLFNREHEVDTAFFQQRFLSQFVETIPAFEEDYQAQVIVFDEGTLISGGFGFSTLIEHALRVIYDNPNLVIYVCYPNHSYAWNTEFCRLEADGIYMETISETFVFSYQETVMMRYTADEQLELLNALPSIYSTDAINSESDPSQFICETCSYPETVDTFFTEFPFSWHTNNAPLLKDFIRRFGISF